MHEQYRPASAPLTEDAGRRPRSSVFALALGGLIVDWGGTQLVDALLTQIWPVFKFGLRASELPASLWQQLDADTRFQITYQGLGYFMSLAGGYAAASWVPQRPLLHGLGAGLTSVSFYLLLELVHPQVDLWFLAFTPPLALLGGYLHALRHRAR